jgi:hypothetical protein
VSNGEDMDDSLDITDAYVTDNLKEREINMIKDAYRHPFEYISPLLYFDFKKQRERDFL